MKNIILAFLVSTVLTSCALGQSEEYSFSNFKDTPSWDLAKAVSDDDAGKVKEILETTKVDVNYKDPEFQQTLLTLSIVNKRQNAFVALLKGGANPNGLVGEFKDSSPLICAIEHQDNCDTYYIENLLKYKANPNMEIKNPNNGYYFGNSFPLIVAVSQNAHNGESCLSIVKILVDKGADINCCVPDPDSELCEGVISECLTNSSIDILKYFVVDKNINIPDKVYARGEGDKKTMRVYSLSEALDLEDFKFDNVTDEMGIHHDMSKQKQAKNDILIYLKKTGKK